MIIIEQFIVIDLFCSIVFKYNFTHGIYESNSVIVFSQRNILERWPFYKLWLAVFILACSFKGFIFKAIASNLLLPFIGYTNISINTYVIIKLDIKNL